MELIKTLATVFGVAVLTPQAACTAGRTLSLRVSESVVSKEEAPPMFPADGVEVLTEVVQVSHPLVDSPSIVGDHSVATLRLLSGVVPTATDVVQINLAFDHGGLGLRGPFTPGQRVTVRFTSDGKFFDTQWRLPP